MPVTFTCPRCGRALLIHDELGIKTRRCSGCGEVVEISAASAAPKPPPRRDEIPSPEAAIESGHLDQFLEFLAERHHAPQQRRMDGGRRWGVFVMSPAEVVELARQYREKFDMYVDDAVSPHGKGLRFAFHPKRIDRGCLSLVGLALPIHLPAWLQEHGSVPPESLSMEKSPMDGHPVQLNFIGAVQKDARRPSRTRLSPGDIATVCRERLYTLGWNRQEVEMMYFGVQSAELGGGAMAGGPAKSSTTPAGRLGPRELALLQHIFACSTGARQINDALVGVDAILAAPVASRVFAAEVADLVSQCEDVDLCAVFHGLDVTTVPLNDNCPKHFKKQEGRYPTLAGPDPRMITLTFLLAALAETRRTAPAETLAQKLIAQFTEKCRRGVTTDATDEWHIGRWGQVYYTAAAAIMMKERIERYCWALPILDAVVIEHRQAEEPLYWRAMAAYRYWLLKPQSPNRIHMAQKRLAAVVSASQKSPFEPARLDRVKQFLVRVGAGK